MSTTQTQITTSMLWEYFGDSKNADASKVAYYATALLAEILNGEIDLEQIRIDVLAETQP